MKLRFDPNLDYQREAISAIIDLLDGQRGWMGPAFSRPGDEGDVVPDQLQRKEWAKIECGNAHPRVLDVDFRSVASADERLTS